MQVRLIIDSASDIKVADAAEKGLWFIPLTTRIDGEEYRDGIDLSHEDFYRKLKTCKEMPTTSQIPPYAFQDLFEKLEPEEEAVVITLSGKLSGTAQSALIAAEPLAGKVYVVDSETVTAGEQILIEYAIKLRDQGLSAKRIAETLNQEKSRIRLVALVDTLEYLMRGGRLSRTAAIAGTLLHIKPIICVEDGIVKVLGKARGTKQSTNLLNKIIGETKGVDFSMPALLAYTGLDDSMLMNYIEANQGMWEENHVNVPISTIGSTIGTHAGPGAFAFAFFEKK